MSSLSLKSLVSRLNPTCKQSLESAAGLCVSMSHYNVEIEHWLLKLLEAAGNDIIGILRTYGVDSSRLIKDIHQSLSGLKTGNARAPSLSPQLVDLIREAWLLAGIEFAASNVRSAHLLLALVAHEQLSRLVLDISDEFKKLSATSIQRDWAKLITSLVEGSHDTVASAQATAAATSSRPSNTPALDQYTIDLIALAKSGKIDPVLGRDAEIRQLADILTRRRQNNPILVGDAGVGKTAVVEGFAQLVLAGDVPPALRGISLRTLDLGLLQAGAGVKGEFENRLKNVIAEAQASAQPVILFIDEAHTMIGAGGQSGQSDAANLLKPALARGELRTIAATTWVEYKEFFEKDAALTRRFQLIKVEEPTEASACQMMRGCVPTLEQHHHVRILDQAVVDAVKLSHRYLSGRQLPDKCFSVLDTACARVAISHNATPPRIEDCRRRVQVLHTEMALLHRETATGAAHENRLAELKKLLNTTDNELAQFEAQWHQEASLVKRMRDLRDQLESAGTKPRKNGRAGRQHAEDAPGHANTGSTAVAAPPIAAPSVKPLLSPAARSRLRKELDRINGELKTVQGESPLLHVCVDAQAVAEIIAGWTGIPVGRMRADEVDTVLNLRQRLEQRIIGQPHALEAIARAVRTSRANLTDPRKPVGVFLMVGPSGVGKTETALALAEQLYGGEQNLTVINMSEFKEEHKVSLLMGSPPGYVGYGKGGVLTEAVRRKPYSVLLLDEMEKAHPGVQEIFYQVFDKGTLRDGEGRDVDFKNTLIVMTSNTAAAEITAMCEDPQSPPVVESLATAIEPVLLRTFKQAFLGRVTVVPYLPLGDDVMRSIVENQLKRVTQRLRDSYNATLRYSSEVVEHIVNRCRNSLIGAREVEQYVAGSLLPDLSSQLLTSEQGAFAKALVTIEQTPTNVIACRVRPEAIGE